MILVSNVPVGKPVPAAAGPMNASVSTAKVAANRTIAVMLELDARDV